MGRLLDIQRWMEKHGAEVNRKYAGKWIAVSGEGVEATGVSVSELKRKVPQAKLSSMLLTRIPLPKEVGILAV